MRSAIPREAFANLPISAAEYNKLRANALELDTRLAGIESLVVALTAGKGAWDMAIVRVAPSGPTVPAQDCRYSVSRVCNPNEVLDNILPTISRPARGTTRIEPAVVGDPCFVLRVPDGSGTFSWFLWCPTESLAFAACSPDGVVTLNAPALTFGTGVPNGGA